MCLPFNPIISLKKITQPCPPAGQRPLCPPWLRSHLPGKLTPPSLCSQPSPEGGLTAS